MSGNFLKINDIVTFSLTSKDLIRVKDDYEAISNSSLFPANPNIGQNPSIQNNANGILVRIAATHSGIVTRNNGFYLPDRMKKGSSSFTDNYPAPILIHHKDHEDNIGRVVGQKYVDTSHVVSDFYKLKEGFSVRDKLGKEIGIITDALLKDFVDGKMPFGMQVDVIRTLFKDSLLEDKDYSGLGYIEILANITDKDAVNKLLDGRYLTGSVGATTDKAICSVCKQDLVESGFCEHKPGGIYDGVKAFIIAGNLSYEEYSFVNVPADRHSKVLELFYNGVKDSITIANDYLGRIYEVELGFPKRDSIMKEEESMANTIEPVNNQEKEVVITDSVVAPSEESKTGENSEQVVEEKTTDSKEQESLDDFLTRVIVSTTITDEDEERLYALISDRIMDNASKYEEKEEMDLEKIIEEMEKFVQELEGEDEDLAEESVEDASKEKPQDKPGGSNVGKYKEGSFCGPAGGAPKGSFPVNTKKRAIAALAYAKNAPNPSGIKECVCKHWKDLPACKEMKSKKDSLLTKEQRKILPKSDFCMPTRVFPITSEDHCNAVLSIIKEYKGSADISEIENTLLRKAKVKGFTINKMEIEPKMENTEKVVKDEKAEIKDSGLTRVAHMFLSTLEEAQDYQKEPVLTEEEVESFKMILKRLIDLIGQDSFSQVLLAQELPIVNSMKEESVLLEEIKKYEDKICELKDKLELVQKEYITLENDAQSLQDSLVEANLKIRNTKQEYVTLLTSLRDGKIDEGRDWSKVEDSVIDFELGEIKKVINVEVIASKLNDGMSRVPTGTVDNPVGVQQDSVRWSKRSLEAIQEHYHTLLLSGPGGSERAEAYIQRMKKEGKLPQ